ncbi:MAG: hypothetical protein MZV70_42175 [Desulfobacterales bacterium]|nr:hypothetical protein [Desulfobacterales bacterium]
MLRLTSQVAQPQRTGSPALEKENADLKAAAGLNEALTQENQQLRLKVQALVETMNGFTAFRGLSGTRLCSSLPPRGLLPEIGERQATDHVPDEYLCQFGIELASHTPHDLLDGLVHGVARPGTVCPKSWHRRNRPG